MAYSVARTPGDTPDPNQPEKAGLNWEIKDFPVSNTIPRRCVADPRPRGRNAGRPYTAGFAGRAARKDGRIRTQMRGDALRRPPRYPHSPTGATGL